MEEHLKLPKKEAKNFRWSEAMHSDLVRLVIDYKTIRPTLAW